MIPFLLPPKLTSLPCRLSLFYILPLYTVQLSSKEVLAQDWFSFIHFCKLNKPTLKETVLLKELQDMGFCCFYEQTTCRTKTLISQLNYTVKWNRTWKAQRNTSDCKIFLRNNFIWKWFVFIPILVSIISLMHI